MKVRLYLVDDSAETLEVLRLQYAIHSEVAIVGWADNVADAWEEVQLVHPHVVSIDAEIKHESGIDLCARIRKHFPEAFLAVCSVDSTNDRKIAAKQAGADYFLPKPVSYQDIRKMLGVYRHATAEARDTRPSKEVHSVQRNPVRSDPADSNLMDTEDLLEALLSDGSTKPNRTTT